MHVCAHRGQKLISGLSTILYFKAGKLTVSLSLVDSLANLSQRKLLTLNSLQLLNQKCFDNLLVENPK